MTSLCSDIDEIKMYNKNNIKYNGTEDIIKQENDIHISVIKPITKRTITCVESKTNLYDNPVEQNGSVTSYIEKKDEEYEHTNICESTKKTNLNSNKAIPQDKITFLKKFNLTSLFNMTKNSDNNNSNSDKNMSKNAKKYIEKILFKNNDNSIPKIETVFKPKLEKYVEVVSYVKEKLNVDNTYLIPKPIIIPVEVPVIKFKDNYKIVPIKQKIIPLVKYTDEIIYVDCCIEKPYIVYEDIVLPIPFDVPIEENKYIDRAPPISM
ncbi:inner membrane complex protein 1d, putative [Hepatocystis sp. ex Piliocolobus tephrosceles]|nr:inner membrane complex protein 1d, putative [Hepatocystis sp. ex Piliocolobus tephrosceles]